MPYAENTVLGFVRGYCTTVRIILAALIFLKLFLVLTVGRCKSMKCLVGKTAIVTGGSSGMGFETALVLASRGCRVIIADKNPSQKPKEEIIARTSNPNVELKYLNLASLKSVRKFAAEINETETRLDLLINNAGVGAAGNNYTEDGLHPTMQINHFGPFLLTHLLVGLLKKSAPSRIVFTASAAAFFALLTRDNLNYPEHNSTASAINHAMVYSNSKLCNVISAKGFNSRLESSGVKAYSLHPGLVNTPIIRQLIRETKAYLLGTLLQYGIWSPFGKTPHEGAQTILHVALSDDVTNQGGQYFADCRSAFMPPRARNDKFCEQIWQDSEKIAGVKEEETSYL